VVKQSIFHDFNFDTELRMHALSDLNSKQTFATFFVHS